MVGSSDGAQQGGPEEDAPAIDHTSRGVVTERDEVAKITHIAVENGKASVYDIIQAVLNCSRKRARRNLASYVASDNLLCFGAHTFKPESKKDRPKEQPVVASWAEVTKPLDKMTRNRSGDPCCHHSRLLNEFMHKLAATNLKSS